MTSLNVKEIFFRSALLFFFYIVFILEFVESKACSTDNANQLCVETCQDIYYQGDGSTTLSCMSCRPASGTCASGCQNLIDLMYVRCDGVILPDGFYYDPEQTLSGCWNDVKDDIKIAVERCGCDGAEARAIWNPIVTLFATLTTLFVVMATIY
mmetsp:Transcript_10901/g.14194  ORF Transcript_10901/g.14194 Transcript_10901/m.14194 type:complete len:154 (+) Transcript_10901:249-710(+)